MTAQQFLDEAGIGDIAFDENSSFADTGTTASRKIIEYDNLFSAIEQGMTDMAADITRAAGDKNRHGILQGGYCRSILKNRPERHKLAIQRQNMLNDFLTD
jgi:hypothetical protein